MLEERRMVLLEPQRAQPICYVHRRLPTFPRSIARADPHCPAAKRRGRTLECPLAGSSAGPARDSCWRETAKFSRQLHHANTGLRPAEPEVWLRRRIQLVTLPNHQWSHEAVLC
jgi:hypothetical protein